MSAFSNIYIHREHGSQSHTIVEETQYSRRMWWTKSSILARHLVLFYSNVLQSGTELYVQLVVYVRYYRLQYYILVYFYFQLHLKRLSKMCSMLLFKYGWVCVHITADGCNIGIENVYYMYTHLIVIFYFFFFTFPQYVFHPQCMFHSIYIWTYTSKNSNLHIYLLKHPIIIHVNSFYFNCRQKMWISALFGLFLSDLLDIAAASSNYDGKNEVKIRR